MGNSILSMQSQCCSIFLCQWVFWQVIMFNQKVWNEPAKFQLTKKLMLIESHLKQNSVSIMCRLFARFTLTLFAMASQVVWSDEHLRTIHTLQRLFLGNVLFFTVMSNHVDFQFSLLTVALRTMITLEGFLTMNVHVPCQVVLLVEGLTTDRTQMHDLSTVMVQENHRFLLTLDVNTPAPSIWLKFSMAVRHI